MSCEGACAHAHVRCAVARVRVRAKRLLKHVCEVCARGHFWPDHTPHTCDHTFCQLFKQKREIFLTLLQNSHIFLFLKYLRSQKTKKIIIQKWCHLDKNVFHSFHIFSGFFSWIKVSSKFDFEQKRCACGCEVRPSWNEGAHTCACELKSGRARCVRATQKTVATHALLFCRVLIQILLAYNSVRYVVCISR